MSATRRACDREVTVTIDAATCAARATNDALHLARAAFPAWSQTPPAERGALLRAAAHRVAAREQELAALTTTETGKPADAALGGVRAGVNTLLQYAELGPLHRGTSLRGNPCNVDLSLPHPRGVVLALTPWNDPVAVAAGLLGAAIVSGNVVVHKPSERSPDTGARFTQLLAQTLPADVLTLVSGDGAVGAELARADGIAVLAHVGSSATGRSLARIAAITDAHTILENGGNDALIVDRDVDPVWAAEQAALGAFANAGQICTSVERIYLHRDIAAPFTAALVTAATEWNSGPLPRLVDERMRDSVHEHVSQALRAGARALTGGTPGAGTWYPATVLADCTDDMLVMTEETFGPVAPILVVDSFDEALLRTAASPYGLAATVLTSDMTHAHRAAAQLPVGTVKINNVFGGAPGGSAQPRGASGTGFGYGPELLTEMTTTTVVHFGLPGGAP
ncbi:aldehyde dehydrogenase [Rathayibacter toxicus]|uniref:aldehyde dehydrogenase family protein n=1 Tax=Rathayibacter toxicus TaxID=145458 RepID=UPI0005B243AB|nr:aldehyde dehydrogenase family protein [Rathayibacter toxicus]AJM77370.1 succinate-semialdehyde dehydrogenase [Rathayibacter toxicus]ALS56741.1 succinate-semialdehyde dehydrogenase [Rathayibacter toxicus]PPG22472.1 aldehyde dehydrogenase [Rathayibacter toxicus]PPG47193.1 aldehyde dehydrogenase [Rathayibacter toxicus]PPH64030.1 aldehyde dehydrogenase [Rathayibacter toxicus]